MHVIKVLEPIWLTKPETTTRVHHAAVDIRQIGEFMARLRVVGGRGARALEFAVLTAARSGEVRGATWNEIDMPTALWTVPADRMKSGREHRVPLSKAAIGLLRAQTQGDTNDLVFPGTDGPLSDMTLTAVLRRMKVDAMNKSSKFSPEVRELAVFPLRSLSKPSGNESLEITTVYVTTEKRRQI